MPQPRSRLILLAACLSVATGLQSAAAAAPKADPFLDARDAFQKGDASRLDARAAELDGHPLQPYARYWQLRMRIDQLTTAEVKPFLDEQAGTLVGDRMRADWLRQLAKRQQWADFRAEYPDLSTEDTQLICLEIQARIATGETDALPAARAHWYTGKVQPDSCLPLFGALFEQQLLGVEDVWIRVRLALESGNRAVARAAVDYLPKIQRPDPRLFDSIARSPQKYLDKRPLPVKSRAQRELTIYALYKSAESWPQLAAQRLSEIAQSLPKAERDYAWGQVAMSASWKHHPEALDWFNRANEASLNDTQLAWKVRAALRAAAWPSVMSAVDAMSAGQRERPEWRYWKGRALSALGRQPEANALFAQLSNGFHFYGQLAAEELGASISTVPQTYTPGHADVEAIAENPGLRRALALYRSGLRYEGALEWQWATSTFDDKALLAAAELAMRNEWYERGIHTADRTRVLHDFTLRYPAPYRERLREVAAPLDLDEAWIYGLIRQESRFVTTARSSAGAGGLMQLMPSTAKWVAKRLGLTDHHSTLVDGVDTNLSMGSYYLRQVLDSLDNSPTMATAGYNAGPRRAAQWRAPTPLEGAVYAETIPFPETRDYVKKVMSNTMYYARLFRNSANGLRERLGIVQPRIESSN
jgi:soluble lytic murein transglycosylase